MPQQMHVQTQSLTQAGTSSVVSGWKCFGDDFVSAHRFMRPMEDELRAVGQAMAGLGDAVVAVLGERGTARDMKSLQQAIDHVQDER